MPGAVPPKPKAWLQVFPELAGRDVERPFSVTWAMKLTRSIARDADWSNWWAPSRFAMVELAEGMGRITTDRFGSRGTRLYLMRSWPTRPSDDEDIDGKSMWRDEVFDALSAIGDHVGLGPLPPMLPAQPAAIAVMTKTPSAAKLPCPRAAGVPTTTRSEQTTRGAVVCSTHPAFAAHFTHPVYTDSAGEFSPFGTDEGADVLATVGRRWCGPTTTLNDVLTGDGQAESQGSMTDRTADELDDATVIGAGFALLRFTGQIDRVGREQLAAALRRSQEQWAEVDGGVFQQLIGDLDAYPSR